MFTHRSAYWVLFLITLSLLLPNDVQAQATADDDEEQRRRILELGLGAPGSGSSSPDKQANPEEPMTPMLTEREKVAHVLNRMAFGPRPGQVDQVLEMGLESWMRSQLDPASIDNPYIDQIMQSEYSTVGMSNGDLFRKYRPPYTPYKNKPPTKKELEKRREEQRERRRLEGIVKNELRGSVYHRAIYSERQFEEVIVAFWREHFSIDQGKDDVAYLANNWEEEVLRKYAFGKFEHMLLASARHPAMLVYLDNIISQKPLTEREVKMLERYEDREYKPRSVLALQRHRGLNENYARELMELHTLGVDREYTQRDVTELARVLTGWSAGWADGSGNEKMKDGEKKSSDYTFRFKPDFHDTRNKYLLGRSLRGGGEDQGITVIRGLAKHRYTADYISRKLCAYLLRDEPSEALVKHVAGVYRKTGGDLPKVYEAIIFSDDFFYRQNHRVKFKTPFEYVVSSLRVTGAEVSNFNGIDRALNLMGQPTYRCPDPTGWYDSAESWLDPGVLVYRWTFALDLASNRLDGVRVPEAMLANLPAKELKAKLEKQVVPAGLSERTSTIIDNTLGNRVGASEMLGVILGSPDFQQQ